MSEIPELEARSQLAIQGKDVNNYVKKLEGKKRNKELAIKFPIESLILLDFLSWSQILCEGLYTTAKPFQSSIKRGTRVTYSTVAG